MTPLEAAWAMRDAPSQVSLIVNGRLRGFATERVLRDCQPRPHRHPHLQGKGKDGEGTRHLAAMTRAPAAANRGAKAFLGEGRKSWLDGEGRALSNTSLVVHRRLCRAAARGSVALRGLTSLGVYTGWVVDQEKRRPFVWFGR